jgi:hypothetical protein
LRSPNSFDRTTALGLRYSTRRSHNFKVLPAIASS